MSQQKKPTHVKPKALEDIKTSRTSLFSGFFRNINTTTTHDSLLKKIFTGLSALFFVITLILSQKAGINADDRMQNEYEQNLMKFYATMGRDTGALNMPKTQMHFYGGVFEVLSGVTNKILGQDNPDLPGYHKVRHAWSAVFGTSAMVFTGLMAAALGGWLAAIIALILIFFTPSFLGHSLMNPKDIPFALGYIMSIYYTYKLLIQMPAPKRSTLLLLGVGLGISLGVRAGGLMNFAILAMMLGLHFLATHGFAAITRDTKTLLAYLKAFFIPALSGWVIALLFWPYAMHGPVSNILSSLSTLADYGVNIRLLFNGEMYFAQSLPKSYLPMWLLVTVPVIVLLGWLLHLIFIGSIWKKYNPGGLFLILFAFIFPFAYVMYKGSTIYDGWRHMLFPYTAGIVVAALAFAFLADKFWQKPVWHYSILGIVALGCLSPAIFTIKNPAYPYVYFNELVGGIQGADGKWENDYWGTSVKQGVEYLEQQGILHEGMKDTVRIASNFFYPLDKYVKHKYGGHVKVIYLKYRQRYDQPWDYALFVNRFMDASYLQKKNFPPASSIHAITANGVPLLAILRDTSHHTTAGMAELRKQNWQQAIKHFDMAIKEDPKNEVAYAGMANAFLTGQQLKEVKIYVDKCLEIDPDNSGALNYLGMYYINNKEIDKGAETFQRAIDIAPNNSIGYYYLALIAHEKGNLQEAAEKAARSIETNPKFAAGYTLLASLYNEAGMKDKAQEIIDMMPKDAK